MTQKIRKSMRNRKERNHMKITSKIIEICQNLSQQIFDSKLTKVGFLPQIRPLLNSHGF